MISIEGQGGISATVVQDSTAYPGNRITTFELVYPRFIHAEFMTHRMISKNAASSRAIPVDKMHANILHNTAVPIYWGKNQPGMKAKEELDDWGKAVALANWVKGRDTALNRAKVLHDGGLHKQIANRPTEAYQMMKTVATATEWANLLWLRDHEDAQPEFRELAKCISKALTESIPQHLCAGEWHVPYVDRKVLGVGIVEYFTKEGICSEEEALIISAACCAQVSYRTNDDSLAKCRSIFNKLINTEPVHASPVEHQATPMSIVNVLNVNKFAMQKGITHVRVEDNSTWSGNFKGWIQHRQLIPGHTKW